MFHPIYGTEYFSQPGRAFSAIVRFSNSQGTFEKDGTGTARGLAIRLLDVAGTRAVPDDGGNTQDFLMVDNPRFPFRDPKAYVEIIKRKVMGADLSPKIGELSALAHMALFEHDELKILKEIKGKHVASPLEIKYWSGTPFWLGRANGDGGHAVKYSAVSRLAGRTPPPDQLDDLPGRLSHPGTGQRFAIAGSTLRFQGAIADRPASDASGRCIGRMG